MKNKKLLNAFLIIFAILVGGLTIKMDIFTSPKYHLRESIKALWVPNPLEVYNSIEEAEKELGFNVITPNYMPSGYKLSEIIVINDKILNLEYKNNQNNVIVFRNAQGSDDISGDYNIYNSTTNLAINNATLTMKGNSDVINLTLFQSKNQNIVSIYSKTGVPKEEIVKIIENLKQYFI